MSDLRKALRTLADNGLTSDSMITVVNELIENETLDDCDVKWLALVSELGAEMLDADETTYDNCVFRVGGDEYLILTEDERDSRWDDYLESCLDDSGIVPGADSPYFDRERWKEDARIDGAGVLSSYDGTEYEFFRPGVCCYIYRTN